MFTEYLGDLSSVILVEDSGPAVELDPVADPEAERIFRSAVEAHIIARLHRDDVAERDDAVTKLERERYRDLAESLCESFFDSLRALSAGGGEPLLRAEFVDERFDDEVGDTEVHDAFNFADVYLHRYEQHHV